MQRLAAAEAARREGEEALRDCRTHNEELQLARDAMLQDLAVRRSPERLGRRRR